MKNNILTFLAGFCTLALGVALPFTASASDPVQWTIASGGNGHYYQAISATNGISWQQANSAAAALGGYLATVTSAEENDFIYSVASADDSLWNNDGNHAIGPWLGGFQPAGSPEPDGGWSWVTGEPFSYSAWATFEPSDGDGIEDRITYFGFNGVKDKTWNDYPHDPLQSSRPPVPGYIVEWSSAPGAADGQIAVYKIGATYTRIGDSKVERATVSGYMLMDLTSNNIVVVRTDPVKKVFHTSTPTVSVATINASAVRADTAIKFHSDDLVSALAEGQNVNVTINYDSSKHPIIMAIPIAFIVGGFEILTSSTGEAVTRDYHGAIALDRPATLAANKKGYDVSTYSAVLQAALMTSGYRAIP